MVTAITAQQKRLSIDVICQQINK